MNASRRWLEAFLRRPLEVHDLIEKLANLGAPADAVEPIHAELRDILVAVVEEVRPHPSADRLRLCTVNDGSGTLKHVVCGASNVEAGLKYPFAPVGATLPGGLTIEKRKLRGEPSEGMLCSARELGLGEDHDGLLTLDTEAAPGTRLLDSLDLADDRLVLDTSPARGDQLGHKGLARELAVAYRTGFRLPDIPGATPDAVPPVRRAAGASGETAGVTVAIEPAAGCARFTGAVVRGVAVGPSPLWLRRRLESVGLRSIGNVVDATNYVLFELGQPLHAYDLATLRGGWIAARLAAPGEHLITLDGVERKLAGTMTVIADADAVRGVAGVMGGRDSEVGPGTTDLFLECAWFDPRATRRTRRALGLATEASHRFERGTDLWGVPDALRRCLELILAVAGGRVEGEPVDVWPEPRNPARIFLRTARTAQILGAELPLHEIERCLVAVGAAVVAKPADGRLAVDVPGWRPDLIEEIDLIEEVARVHGYGAFSDELRPFRTGNQTDAPVETAARSIRAGLGAEGLYEAITLPMGPEDGSGAVAILNPPSAEHGFLRTRLLSGLTRQVELNWANQVRDVRLFEIGTVFASEGPGARPREATHVAGVLTGARWPAHWSDGGHTPDVDQWDLRGLFERAVSLAIPAATVQVENDRWVARLPEGERVGEAGPLAADAPPWAPPLWGFELRVDPAPRAAARYAPLPVTPASSRDLALLVPDGVTVATVLAAVRENGTLLESVAVLDEYRGPGLPAGRRGVALRLTFRGRERTLRDSDVDGAVQRILGRLETACDVTLRTA